MAGFILDQEEYGPPRVPFAEEPFVRSLLWLRALHEYRDAHVDVLLPELV